MPFIQAMILVLPGQNEILLEGLTAALTADGFTVLRPRLLPANDGAVSLGQAAVARARLANG